MSEVTRQDAEIIEDRFRLFSEVILSWPKAQQLCHQAKHYAGFRTVLEQMAEGGRSNADFSAWAKKVLENEKADRPKRDGRSKPLVRVRTLEGV
jgi:hypothetical protein